MDKTTPVIAVVDDEESVRRALGRLLRSAGFAVEAFAAGDGLLDALNARRIDCIVLDLHMPQPDGFEVLQRMVADGQPTPVVVLTGHDSAESRQRVSSIGGASRFLRKPIDDQILIDAIQAAIVDHRRHTGAS